MTGAPGQAGPGRTGAGREGPQSAAVSADVAGQVTITTYEDGPLLVRGDVRIVTQDGELIRPGRATVALCRCGHSGRKPFCDGTHKVAKFRAPAAPDARPDTGEN